MNEKRIARLGVVLGVVAALGLAPTAAGGVGQKASPLKWCPQRAAALCQRVGLPLRPEEQEQVKIHPQAETDSRGQQVWRAGSWLMY